MVTVKPGCVSYIDLANAAPVYLARNTKSPRDSHPHLAHIILHCGYVCVCAVMLTRSDFLKLRAFVSDISKTKKPIDLDLLKPESDLLAKDDDLLTGDGDATDEGLDDDDDDDEDDTEDLDEEDDEQEMADEPATNNGATDGKCWLFFLYHFQ